MSEYDANYDLVHMKNRIRSWLSAPEFARELERARECRETGTSGWFFEEKAFQKWSHYYQEVEARTDVKIFGANTIWVQGLNSFPSMHDHRLT